MNEHSILAENGPFKLHVEGSPQPFLIDKTFSVEVTRFNWKYHQHLKRARATPGRNVPRVTLHKFILGLKGIEWEEVCFSNGNQFDCPLENLLPYRREEEGAKRRVFRGKKIPYKGVSLKRNGKYVASIRRHGTLKHLGYFNTAEDAGEAFKKAYLLLHSPS